MQSPKSLETFGIIMTRVETSWMKSNNFTANISPFFVFKILKVLPRQQPTFYYTEDIETKAQEMLKLMGKKMNSHSLGHGVNTYLILNENTVGFRYGFGDIRNQRILQVTKATRLSIRLNPCKMWELQK